MDFGGITIFTDNYPPEVQLLFRIHVPFDEQIDSNIEMPDADAAEAKRVKPFQEIVKNNGRTFQGSTGSWLDSDNDVGAVTGGNVLGQRLNPVVNIEPEARTRTILITYVSPS
jgi:hypothetical protein